MVANGHGLRWVWIAGKHRISGKQKRKINSKTWQGLAVAFFSIAVVAI